MKSKNGQGEPDSRKADAARLYALLGGATRCCEAKAQSDGTDAVAAMLSLIDRRRWFALHIFAHKSFLEVTHTNVGGGYIVIGVEEKNGSPVIPIKGIEQERIDGILKELIGLCHFIEPLYNPIVEPVMFQGKYVIVIWAAGGYGRPYKVSKDIHSDKSTKLYYIRKFSSTIVASPDEERDLFYVSTDIPFDDRPNLAADVSDLDIGLMRQHLKEIGSDLYELSINMDALDIAKNMQFITVPIR